MNKKNLSIIAIFLIILVSGLNISSPKSIGIEKRGENLIRFHVLANSDSPEDQLLKLKVRDRVIDYVSNAIEGLENVDETRLAIEENLEIIQVVAEQEILENQLDYKVAVYLGEHTFPTKRYGDVVFPAGNYEALRIVIGEGFGENWWCVMFPPLCFVDVKHGLTDEKTKQHLKESLSHEEYEIIYTSTDNQQLPLQLRSKVFEIFKESRIKLDQTLAWLF